MLDLGHVAPHGRFVHVFLNGKYWGQYHLREKWNGAMFSSYFGHDEDDYEAIDGDNQGADFGDGTMFQGSGKYWQQALAIAKNSKTPWHDLQPLIDLPNYLDFLLLWSTGCAEPEFQAVGAPELGIGFRFHLKDADGFLRRPLHRLKSRGPGGLFHALKQENHPKFNALLRDRIKQLYQEPGRNDRKLWMRAVGAS